MPCDWQNSQDSDFRCPFPVFPPSTTRCVLHAGIHTQGYSEEFQRVFKHKIEASDYDFREVYFFEKVDFSNKFLSGANFKRANFKEAVSFEKAIFENKCTFESCYFHGVANFNGAEFNGSASFCQTQFSKILDLGSVAKGEKESHPGVIFHADADFSCALFKQGLHLSGTWFMGDTNFRESVFEGKVSAALLAGNDRVFAPTISGHLDLAGSHFQEEVRFSHTEFRGGVSLSNSVFVKQFFCERCEFEGNEEKSLGAACFNGAKFQGNVFFLDCSFSSSVDFKNAHIESEFLFRPQYEIHHAPFGIRFENVRILHPDKIRFENVDLSKASFVETNMRRIDFQNVKYALGGWVPFRMERMRNLLGKILNQYAESRTPSDKLMARIRSICFSKHKNIFLKRFLAVLESNQLIIISEFFGRKSLGDSHGLVGKKDRREAFRRLYRDMRINLETSGDYADAGDFYYGEMELRRKAHWIIRFFSPYTLYWLSCGYGQKPLRALILFLIFVFVFGAVHTWQDFSIVTSDTSNILNPDYFSALQHSLRSMTLQFRYTAIEPHSNPARGLTLLGNILGPIQLGLFGLSIRRRFRR